jgi:hypothetical protein
VREAFAGRNPTRTSKSDVRERPKQRTVYITSPDEAQRERTLAPAICRDYREAYASQNPTVAIKQVYDKYTAMPGVSLTMIRAIVTTDRRNNRHLYETHRSPPKKKSVTTPAEPQPTHTEATQPIPPRTEATQPIPPRPRRDGLPPITTDIDLTNLTRIVATGTNPVPGPGNDIATDLAAFTSAEHGDYGYLAWRYDTVQRLLPKQPDENTELLQLAIVARIVQDENRLVDEITASRGDFLTNTDSSRRAIHSEFSALFDSGDYGRLASDELRRSRAKSRFLRRAFVMAIASENQTDHLWTMLESLRPPARNRLVEVTAPLLATIDRLNDEISSVALLLTADERALDGFTRRSNTELEALRAGHFDYLLQFNDDSFWTSDERSRKHTLPFSVLEPGEQLRTFLGKMRSTRSYHGYHVDVERLNVLQDLQNHYGASRSRLFKGAVSSHGVNNQYLILAIRPAARTHENAVAISPLAGQHATFVVRGDCSEEHWKDIFASSKDEAARRGARRLVFRGDDPYAAMFTKIVALLDCSAHEFRRLGLGTPDDHQPD